MGRPLDTAASARTTPSSYDPRLTTTISRRAGRRPVLDDAVGAVADQDGVAAGECTGSSPCTVISKDPVTMQMKRLAVVEDLAHGLLTGRRDLEHWPPPPRNR